MNLDDLRKTKVGQLPGNARLLSEPAGVHLDQVAQSKRQRDHRGLSEDQKLETGPAGVGFSVTLISFRRRLVDGHDNLRTGLKPLVDRIAASLGYRDDADPRLSWHYQQFKTDSQEGTLVTIEEVPHDRTRD